MYITVTDLRFKFLQELILLSDPFPFLSDVHVRAYACVCAFVHVDGECSRIQYKLITHTHTLTFSVCAMHPLPWGCWVQYEWQ